MRGMPNAAAALNAKAPRADFARKSRRRNCFLSLRLREAFIILPQLCLFLTPILRRRASMLAATLIVNRAAVPQGHTTNLPPCGVAHPFVPQNGEEHVVLPAAVDAEIFAGETLFAEAALEEEAAARRVVRQCRGFDAMELQALKGEAQYELEARRHVAPARVTLADPIAEAAGLGDAAAHVAEANAADQRIVLEAEHQETVALVGAPIGGVALEAAAKGAARQRIRRPARLPRRKEAPRFAAERRPGLPVAAFGRPQQDALAEKPECRRRCAEQARQAQQVGGQTIASALSGRAARRAGCRARCGRSDRARRASAAP